MGFYEAASSLTIALPPPPPLLRAVRGNYEDGGTVLPRKHDFTRAESENWRSSRDDQNGEEDEGGWRLAGTRRDGDRWCPPSPGRKLHCAVIDFGSAVLVVLDEVVVRHKE